MLRKTKLLTILSLLLIAPLTSCSSGSSDGSKKVDEVSIYVINDTHGAIEANQSDRSMGMSKLYSYIKADEDYNENSILLSAGDMFQGTGLSNLNYGRAMIDAMNTMGFEAMALGNHEFDWGVDQLKDTMSHADFPLLAYDVYKAGTNERVDWVTPSITIERGNKKIGVIGEIGDLKSSIEYDRVKDIDFGVDATYVNSEAARLRNDGCELVILLTHNGPDGNYNRLDPKVVDIIFGGHTHYVENNEFNSIPYYQAGSGAKAMTKAVYNFKTNRFSKSDVISFTSSNVRNTPNDSAVDSVLASYIESSNAILNEKVGTLDQTLYRYASPSGSTYSLGKFITQVMLEYAVAQKEAHPELNIDTNHLFALHNNGGIRANLEGTWNGTNRNYDISYSNVYEVSPFDNGVRVIQVEGSILNNYLESDSYCYNYDSTKTSSVIDPNELYSVVTITYMTTNPAYPLYASDGGAMLGTTTDVYVRDLVAQYFRDNSPITASNYPFN